MEFLFCNVLRASNLSQVHDCIIIAKKVRKFFQQRHTEAHNNFSLIFVLFAYISKCSSNVDLLVIMPNHLYLMTIALYCISYFNVYIQILFIISFTWYHRVRFINIQLQFSFINQLRTIYHIICIYFSLTGVHFQLVIVSMSCSIVFSLKFNLQLCQLLVPSGPLLLLILLITQ